MKLKLPPWQSIHTIVFDFDGVFTNNLVYVDETGREAVACNRSDGLAFDIIRKFISIHKWDVDYFILSKESNPVVATRAKKMKIKSIQSVDKKAAFIKSYLSNNSKRPTGLIYLGNDLNDLEVMMLPGVFSVAPSDAHPRVLSAATLVLPFKGGYSFVRHFIELLLRLECMSDESLIELI